LNIVDDFKAGYAKAMADVSVWFFRFNLL
jgi:hypothetical protein